MKKQLEACVLFVKNEIKTGRIYLILIVLIFVGIAIKGCYSSNSYESEDLV